MNDRALRCLGASLPLAMTAAIVAAAVLHLALGGALREPDEGMAAHLFQLLVPLEIPLIGAFAITRLPRDPRWAAPILALQVVALVALVATVFALGL
jgi:hypothetical protein